MTISIIPCPTYKQDADNADDQNIEYYGDVVHHLKKPLLLHKFLMILAL